MFADCDANVRAEEEVQVVKEVTLLWLWLWPWTLLLPKHTPLELPRLPQSSRAGRQYCIGREVEIHLQVCVVTHSLGKLGLHVDALSVASM